MQQLIHNGVLVPDRYIAIGLYIKINGKPILLNRDQEEMAVAWAKKQGTDYVNDKIFRRNFLNDFKKALKMNDIKDFTEIDFTNILSHIEREKQKRDNMSKEEKKILAAERKKHREELKEKFGYAMVDGRKVEVANYLVEPPSIFMGRGKHPLRGRWKPPVSEEDIILNLSLDAPRPPGNWKEIVWQPSNMWIAKWDDKLRFVEKYIWIADSAYVKQAKEKAKFNAAHTLGNKLNILRKHISQNLQSPDLKRRKIATVCYLIDRLKIRVGDEKDEDEADTVGATTLRPEHIIFKPNNIVRFDFLGKDSIRFVEEIELSDQIIKNLREFMETANSSIFQGVRSDAVSVFLSEVVEEATAKVFRTYHTSKVVYDYLEHNTVNKLIPVYRKKHIATLANLKAAITCNHKKKIAKNWEERLAKKKRRLKDLKKKKEKIKDELLLTQNKFTKKLEENLAKKKRRLKDLREKKRKIESTLRSIQLKIEEKSNTNQMKKTITYKNRYIKIQNRFKAFREKKHKIDDQIIQVRKKAAMKRREILARKNKRLKTLKERVLKTGETIETLKLKIEEMKMTKEYNLGTSLKSYIDPRIYYEWGKKIDYDWKLYYPKTLQRKFSWVENKK